MTTYHLYSDGSYFPRAKKSGFGGYIVDPQGQVIVEYSEQIKQSEYIHNFELLGIIRGLLIAKDKGIENIVSHCDDKGTASRLKEIFEQGVFRISTPLKPELYEKIQDISTSFKKIKFEYIPRTQNKYADSLSRRYSVLMENNFLKHYDNELDMAEKKFAEKGKLPKRMFFSHPQMVRNPNKNNPFLVATNRNKKVRKLSRAQEEKNYEFLFIEHFMRDDKPVFRSFLYDSQRKLCSQEEKIMDCKVIHDISMSRTNADAHKVDGTAHIPDTIPLNDTRVMIANFADFFSQVTSSIKAKNLWTFSNISEINSYLEQREKIPQDNSASFYQIFESLNRFEQVFFHHFPFHHLFSPEISLKENKKEKLIETYDSLETLMDNLSHGCLGKEQNKNFGNLIRHHFRNYQKQLRRELAESEKVAIIAQTTDELNKLGYKNLPSLKSIG